MNNYSAFLFLLILIFVVVFTTTVSPKRLHWRRRLLIIIVATWLVVAGFFVPNLFKTRSIFRAVKSGEPEQVRKLISENPKLIQSKTLMGKTPLHLAVESGNTTMVALLLEAGADVNVRGDSVTPLHLAAFYGNAQISEALLKAGAAVNAAGFRHDDTPLHVAALHGHLNVVKVLLAQGASVSRENMLHKTPLQLAQENQRSNVIAFLTNPPSSNR